MSVTCRDFQALIHQAEILDKLSHILQEVIEMLLEDGEPEKDR